MFNYTHVISQSIVQSTMEFVEGGKEKRGKHFNFLNIGFQLKKSKLKEVRVCEYNPGKKIQIFAERLKKINLKEWSTYQHTQELFKEEYHRKESESVKIAGNVINI